MRAKVKAVAVLGVLGVLGIAAILQAGAEGRSPRPAAPRPVPVPRPAKPAPKAEGTDPTRVQIDVFELSCTTDQMATLDLNQIAADDASVAQVLERLNGVGQTRMLARMDDTIALPGEANVTTGHRAPVVTDVVVSGKGIVTPSVQYQEVGMIADVSGQWLGGDGKPDLVQLLLSVEFSGIGRSHVEIASKTKLPMFSECSITKSLLVGSGKPVLTMTNLLPDPTDENKGVVVYVIRAVVTRVNP
jgi:hypothetical protein